MNIENRTYTLKEIICMYSPVKRPRGRKLKLVYPPDLDELTGEELFACKLAAEQTHNDILKAMIKVDAALDAFQLEKMDIAPDSPVSLYVIRSALSNMNKCSLINYVEKHEGEYGMKVRAYRLTDFGNRIAKTGRPISEIIEEYNEQQED